MLGIKEGYTKQSKRKKSVNKFLTKGERMIQLQIPQVISQGAQNHSSDTGSQIIGICVEIYLKIDKMVKMYKSSY